MTGYGYAERQDERYSAVVELKSYNNRYLDVNCSLPAVLSPLETRVRDRVGGACKRGRVEVFVRFRDNEEDLSVTVDSGVVAGYRKAFEEIREQAGIDDTARLEHFISREGVLRSERVVDAEQAWTVLEPLFDSALEELSASRQTEGERLARDVAAQLAKIVACVDAFEKHAGEIEQTIHSGLRRRFEEVLGDEVDQNRILNEVAVQLTRFSINEEIVRLRAHIDSFNEIAFGQADTPGPVGKKLDFLCQELNREINTTGSKSIIVDVNQQVVEAKDALENVREQLRNVE